MLTQMKQAKRRCRARARLSGRLGALREAGQGARPRTRRSSSSPSARATRSSPKAVGAPSADGVVTIAPLDAARRVEGLAGVLRRLRQEVRRATRTILELGARLDVARDPARARWREPGSTRRRCARSSPRTPSRRSTARSGSTACRTRSRRPRSCRYQKGKLQLVWPKSIATGAVRAEEGLVAQGRATRDVARSIDTLLSGPAAVRGAGHRLALRAGRARAEPRLRHDAHAQRRARRRRDARRLRRLLGVHARRRLAARRRPAGRARSARCSGYALYRGLFRRLLASGAGAGSARLEGNSLLLFFGLSIILQNVAALAFTPNSRGLRVLDDVV